MKSSKTVKKLVLRRTTLRTLAGSDLERAVGGISAETLCHSNDRPCLGGGEPWSDGCHSGGGQMGDTCACRSAISC